MPSLSVIIPTYRRADILAECLRRIEAQTIAHDIEVIVVSDGHDEETKLKVESAKWKVAVRFFEIPKSHQGVARNEGVKHASGEYVLFIGDDIFLMPDACEKHVAIHKQLAIGNWHGQKKPIATSQLPTAVLGFTTWDPAVGITPVMEWLERSGWQFGYPAISNFGHGYIPEKTQHRFTYTSHVSLPLSVAQKFPFRTDVHLYGWEDIEWGMRLRDAGVRLCYEPDAQALHHHRMDLAQSLDRIKTLGRSAREMEKLLPGFDRVPRGWKRLAYRVLALFPTLSGRHRKAFLQELNS